MSIDSELRTLELEETVDELERLREEDRRRANAMLRVLTDLRHEKRLLQHEAQIRDRAERQLRAVIESAPNAMIMIDANGAIILVNRAAESVFQYAREEMIGQPIENLIPPRFRPDHPEKRQRFFRNPQTMLIGQGRTLYGRRKNGEDFVVEIGLNPIEMDDGLYVLSSIIDVTARKYAQESTARLAAIVESSHDAILTESLDGVIQSWNRGAERMYGYLAHDVVGRNVAIIVPPDLRDEKRKVLEMAGGGQTIQTLETQRRCMDGRIIDVAISASPLLDHDQNVVGVSVIARDITQRKKSERILAQYAADLERSNRELEQFAYVASHDLKEPLRMVGSYTSLLAEEFSGKLGPDADRYITYASDAARRMSVLIDDLLDFSRVGRTDAPFELVKLADVCNQVVGDLQVRIEELGAVIEIMPGLPLIRGSATRLRQLFQNLLSNALKFRHPQRPPQIRISAELADQWEIRVTDNGIGIDKEFYERIFQLFQRLHTINEYPGTGIGLAVCKKIIEQHGGSIRVESEPGTSSCFIISLPPIGYASTVAAAAGTSDVDWGL
ncbi:MAG: PAS domain S-box protein [Planctomycetales bacterium]|nr:PAS domain S-box protein [Planctomycetales bacterium]